MYLILNEGTPLSVNCGIIRPIIGIRRPGQRMVEGGVKVFRNSDLDIEVADRVVEDDV